LDLDYDKEKVTRLASEVSNALKMLRELSDQPRDRFLTDPHLIASAKYFLMVSIEACIDLSYHIISKNRMRVPEDYADTFRVLNENDLLPNDFTDRLIEMSKFRNRLVHIYWNVSDKMVVDILTEDIQDIEDFLDLFLRVLENPDDR